MTSQIRAMKRGQGFTIIEVLIVLAIAGLIMLIVFLAVPSLQRNSRNTQRTTDAGNVLSAISDYVGNNNGQLPAAGATGGTGSNLTIGGSGSNTIPVRLGYYAAEDVSIVTYTPGATNTTTTDTLVVMRGASCSDTTIGNPVSASSRAVAILYTLENDSKQCRAS